eukprot:gene29672-5087_t
MATPLGRADSTHIIVDEWQSLMPHLVTHLARYLSSSDVQRCRLTCARWAAEFADAVQTVALLVPPEIPDTRSSGGVGESITPSQRKTGMEAFPRASCLVFNIGQQVSCSILGNPGQLMPALPERHIIDSVCVRFKCSVDRQYMGDSTW